MKKLLLTLGSIAAVAAPVASVVACGAPAQKHVKLDETKVKAIIPDVKKAIAEILSNGKDSSVPTSTDTITPDGDEFKVVIKLTDINKEITLKVSPDGDVSDLVIDGVAATSEQATKIQTIVKGGTIDHSNDDTDIKNLLVATDYDSDLFKGMTNSFPTAPGNGASSAEKRTYNTEADAFLAEYKPLVAQAALGLLVKDITLTIDTATYMSLVIPQSSELDDAIITSLGFPTDIADELKKLIAGGAKIYISKQKDADVSGSIGDVADTYGWIHGTGLDHNAIGVVSLSDLASARKAA